MSAYDDIEAGLDEIFRSAFVSGSTKGSYKQKYRPEYDRVKAYLDGGVFPNPFPTTLMGSGLTKVERGRRALEPEPPPPPPPPPPGIPIPTFRQELTADAVNMVGSQSWVICTSDNVPVGSWGGSPVAQIRTPMDSGGGGSWEWWCAYQIKFASSWQEGVGGQSSSNPHDWHDCPGQPGWEGQPWDSKYGVSPVHIRYRDGMYCVAHEPNYPNHQFPIFTGVIPKDVWHSVMVRIIFGRTDGRIPAVGHPNGGKGRTYAAWNGMWTLDSGDVSNLWYASESGKFTTRIDVLQGGYWVGGGKTGQNYDYTLARFGRTREECLADKGWDNIVVYRQGGGPPEGWTGQPVISRIADRSSSEFVEP